MLFVPFGWDQPDNGFRVERLGAGLCLARKVYSVENAVSILNRLLTESRFAERVMKIGARLREEDGLTEACDAIVAALERSAL